MDEELRKVSVSTYKGDTFDFDRAFVVGFDTKKRHILAVNIDSDHIIEAISDFLIRDFTIWDIVSQFFVESRKALKRRRERERQQ